ncbi:Ig-like domain-containing protein [Clostridium muellerianum]|uniref:Ig-like domain-containing protein n=1 Tax=Clostridium muellerianum TaxID=2716538 RepID=UPI00247A78F1|nr:Ig-like domain-containing protein [Clostridium muellerianum]
MKNVKGKIISIFMTFIMLVSILGINVGNVFADESSNDINVNVSVTGVSLDKTKSTLAEGDIVQLTATIAPDNATNKNLKWSSSDETIATVDTTGKVTAVKEGTSTITVTTEDGEKTATCSVDVTKKQVLPTDNTFTMLITRDNGASTIKTFTMTIDKDKKNENSMEYLKSVTKVTELQGPGFINGIDGLLNVFLKDMPIEDRKAGYYGIDWFIYLNGSLTPVGATGVHPKAGDILKFDYHKWDWHSLVAPGTKTMPLKIENVPYSSIDPGTPIKLRVTCVFRGVYNVSVKVDGKEVATTDIDGYATIAINEAGEHTIRVEKDDAYKEKKTTVKAVENKVTAIDLNKTESTLTEGETVQLTAKVQPDNATNKNVIWKSSDETIATVDASGKVTSLKKGTTTITVTSADGQKTATCNVTVAKVEKKDYTKSINNLIDGISSTITIDNCDDWLALGLNKTGKKIPEGYLSKLEQRIKAATKNGVLDLGNPTEYERLTLAVLACGGNPTNIAGQNLIEKIYNNNNMADQGINAYVFGLIALQAGNFNIPNNAVWTKEKLINTILSYQEDGGWSYGGGSADPDMTAMAVSALAPYYSTNADVKSAVDIAISRLSQIQDANDGGFASYKTKNSESCSQVIIGLCANGIDPTIDGRFIKNGKNPIDALLTFATGDNKGFGHADNTINGMGTEQGLEALAAYKLFKSGKGSIYSGFTIKKPDSKTMKITNITTKSEFSLGDDAKISIKVENNSDKDQDASLVLALYDGNGEFVDYVCGNQTIKKGDSSILTSMLKLPSQGVYTLKGFVWDTLEAMNPLSDIIEIHVK